jgi:hypothetical protein
LFAADSNHPSLSQYPREQVRYAGQCALIDADRVIEFVKNLGIKFSPEKPVGIPKGLLLDFAAVLRMQSWEAAGIDVHRQIGLTSADEAERCLAILCTASGHKISHSYVFGTLFEKVFDLIWNRFVWEGLDLIGADVLLPTFEDEDGMIEAVAEHLWNSRPHSN